MGRLTADPEYRQTSQGIAVCTFRIAVDRPFSSKNNPNEPTADFFRVTTWRSQADFVSRYFTKGKPIIIEGSIRNNNYTDQSGITHYSCDIQADRVNFCLTDNKINNGGYQQGGYAMNGGYQNGYANNGYNQYNQGGYVPQGNNGYYQPQPPQQPVAYQPQQPVNNGMPVQTAPPTPVPSSGTENQDLQVGQLDDFEEILSDGEIPF